MGEAIAHCATGSELRESQVVADPYGARDLPHGVLALCRTRHGLASAPLNQVIVFSVGADPEPCHAVFRSLADGSVVGSDANGVDVLRATNGLEAQAGVPRVGLEARVGNPRLTLH